jgi:hypothetical protein
MLLMNLAAAILLTQPEAGQIEVRQIIVDQPGQPVARYPQEMVTRLSARCPQGRVEFTYRDLPQINKPRIPRLSVGRTVFNRRQLRIVEELFAGLRVASANISVCSREEDRRIAIHVRFVVSGSTPQERAILAVIYVDERGVFVSPQNFERVRAAAAATGRPPGTDRSQ